MAQPARSLRLVDPTTGEITACPGCHQRDVQLAGAEKDIRSWRARYAQLKASITEDEGHELFPSAKRLFDLWRERCNHPRSTFTPERFALCLPHLRDLGEEVCRRAVDGAAYDCYTTIRRNGTVQRHDGFELIFRSRAKVEEFANRAPHHLPAPEHVVALTKALEFVHPDWELERCVAEAQARLKRWRR